MAEISEQSIDPKRTIVVLNFPSNVGEDELTTHFQNERNGGGNVNDVVLDGSVAFVTFDMPQVATTVLNHHEHFINDKRIDVQRHDSWLPNKKKQEGNFAMNNQECNQSKDAAWTYASLLSKDDQNVLKEANEKPFTPESKQLKTSAVFKLTHDKSILLAKNLNSQTTEKTLKRFVEVKKKADVFNIIFGKDHKAIVILKNEIDKDYSNEESSNENMKLDGSIISLEFAPLTESIRISNIPEGTRLDDIRFKFCNERIGGGPIIDIMMDKKNGIANVYFEKASVVSELVKKEHTIGDVPLTVIPHYNDFEELQTMTTTAFSGRYHIDPFVMAYIVNNEGMDEKFDLRAMKFNESTSQFYFAKEFEDSKHETEFTSEVKEFLHSFVKEDVKIPEAIFQRVKEAIEGKRDEFDFDVVEFKFDGFCVIFVGKREDVAGKKQLVKTMIDIFTDEAQKVSIDILIDDKNKLKFLNFIDYFKKLETEFPEVQIRGMESSSGKLSFTGTKAETKNIMIRISEDLLKISETEVKMSDRQIDFLKQTDCQIVNNELKKNNVMLMLLIVEEAVGASIMSLKKCDNSEEKSLLNIVHAKTLEKCVKVDEKTANLMSKSDKLQKFKMEQFHQHKVLIDQELANICNIWIVCKKSKMKNAEQKLTRLINELIAAMCRFKPVDPMKVRFLKKHCWSEIKEQEKNYKAEGVAVLELDSSSLEIKGTQRGRNEMITFLLHLADQIDSKFYPLSELGKEKQMDATNEMFSEIEIKHKCVIERNTQPEETDGKNEGDGGALTMNLPYHSVSFVENKEIKLASGQKITIIVGDLAQQKVDVIVNTTNHKIDLNANYCGKALLKVAGKELMSECKKIGGLKAGEMASTGPAKLNCERVYHVHSSGWNKGKGAQILRTLIKKCLDQMRKDNLKSIAIPAIGTGDLHCPRAEVTKILFEEVIDYFTAFPLSSIHEVYFVAFVGDQATLDAFLDALQEIKSAFLSRTLSNAILIEQYDGSLELSLGGKSLTVQIVCANISEEKTDLIMHVIGQDFSAKGGVAKALIKAGGNSIIQECKALGKPALYSIQYTKAGKLAVHQIAHVISPGVIKIPDLKKCLDTFFDDVSKKKIARISFSAVGAGAMGFSECQSANLIFDGLCRIAKMNNMALRLIRIAIWEKAKFTKFIDATKAYFSSGSVASSGTQSDDACASHFIKPVKSEGRNELISIKIYSNDWEKIDKAWEEICKNEKTIKNDDIKSFTDGDLEKLRELERDNDVKITVDENKGMATIKGYIADVANVQKKIIKILKNIKDNKSKVPPYWDSSLTEKKSYKIIVPTSSKEYKDVETAFRKTAKNPIVRIERIQNREIYQHYNLKRQAMMKKYNSNFAGKELMLFHGTSVENIEKINANGLNRSYAGQHAAYYGRGVYFARDAEYSCNPRYSPRDSQGLRYMYNARVLVGDYTQGTSTMLVPPNKNTADPNETYDSVVNNISDPTIYVMFHDYEYYTEYLITFK